jgi:transposase
MLVIADRIYSTVNGILHCLNSGADFILRMRKNSFKTIDETGEAINLIEMFERLKDDETADIKAFARTPTGEIVPVRICAKRKTTEQLNRTRKKMKQVQSTHKFKYSDEAKLLNEYIVIVTSLNEITAEQVMETYRLRWQVEICFKRLKSILDFGELPKKTDESTMAWLCGKLMVALLIESIMATLFPPTAKTHNPTSRSLYRELKILNLIISTGIISIDDAMNGF